MDRCSNCLNVLPRTVDRCPVCGKVPESAMPAVEEEPEQSDAPWSRESSRRPTPAPSTPEFLGSLGAPPDPVAAKPRIASPRSARRPKRVGHDGAAPVHEGVRTPDRESDFELPDAIEETRSVSAGSTRINARMRLGKSERHAVYTGLGSILAVLALLSGSVWGFVTSDAGKVGTAGIVVPVTVGEGSLLVTEAIANFDPEAILAVVDSSCGRERSGWAVALESGAVLTAQDAVANAMNPEIALANGTRVKAELVGWDPLQNIAVLEPAEELGARTEFGSTGAIRVGTELAVVAGSPENIFLVPVVVSKIQTSSGSKTSFTVARAEANTNLAELNQLALPAAALVLDREGRVVGVGNGTGNATFAEGVKQTVGALRVATDRPQPTC